MNTFERSFPQEIALNFRKDAFQQRLPDRLSKTTRCLANWKSSSKGKEKTIHDLDLQCCCCSDAKTRHHSTRFQRNWGWDWYWWENEKLLALSGIRDLCPAWETKRSYWRSPDCEGNPEMGEKIKCLRRRTVLIQRALCSPDLGECFTYPEHVPNCYRKFFTGSQSQKLPEKSRNRVSTNPTQLRIFYVFSGSFWLWEPLKNFL